MAYKKPLFLEGLMVAPVPGLEPGTRGLTVHCSNQLSYTGIECFAFYEQVDSDGKFIIIFIYRFKYFLLMNHVLFFQMSIYIFHLPYLEFYPKK